MRPTKAVRPVIQFAEKLGYHASRTRGGHIRFSKPGRVPVFTSSTPGDHRAIRNAISNIRKSEAGRL